MFFIMCWIHFLIVFNDLISKLSSNNDDDVISIDCDDGNDCDVVIDTFATVEKREFVVVVVDDPLDEIIVDDDVDVGSPFFGDKIDDDVDGGDFGGQILSSSLTLLIVDDDIDVVDVVVFTIVPFEFVFAVVDDDDVGVNFV
ncbi:hypothetical protein DERP_009069 [Dermatophagoides pteronyssinus]|uniref:Uncharacterized protein n=1 Tax=Dermatophagoides pteronyssinus TaxID=6956 RepID=A0ABQ8JGF7_DERPT|nr:hypothetical protein DERP_009069 [Dermatophagoides pteronyssinus]